MNTQNNFTTFEELDSHRTSEYTCFLINQLKTEIYSKLPRLTEKEKSEREEIVQIQNTSKNLKDSEIQWNIFYDSLKRKYTNFLELNYITNDILHELYDHLLNYDEHKFSIKNRFFSYSLFLKKMIERTVNEEFEIYLENTFTILKSNALENYDGFWMNAMLQSNFANKDEPSINDLIKFNRDFTSTSILISIELFYKSIERDIYMLLINNLSTRRLILKIEQRSYWVNNNIQPMVYTDDEEWSSDMNRVLNVLFNCVNLMTDIQCLSILADNDCNFVMDKTNCKLLTSIMKNNKKLEILTICRISLDEKSQLEVLETVLKLEQIKFLLFKSAKFNQENKDLIQKFYDENPNTVKHSFYLRFSKTCIITNKEFEKVI